VPNDLFRQLDLLIESSERTVKNTVISPQLVNTIRIIWR
jgi:hypothetical protein